jgi:hypothetical protein
MDSVGSGPPLKSSKVVNIELKLRLIRKAMRIATNSYGMGGLPKRPQNSRKAVTLPKLKCLES